MKWAFLAMLALPLAACSSDDDDNTNPNPNPGEQTEAAVWGNEGATKTCTQLVFDSKGNLALDGSFIGNGDQEFVFKGKQTIRKGTYTLRGWVYVGDGAELTIEPGTIIKGEKASQAALIVEPGGKLIAQGRADAPIVFTSAQPKGQRRPGDWGGLIVCGKAPNNQGALGQQIEGGPRTKHGGNDANDNSGILSYVRVEFAGYPFQKDKEINGITFGSVGSGTQVDHLQVSYSNDDSYEWFGGTVGCRYLVAYNGWDDEFDTDNGFSGRVQYCLSVRSSRIADTSQSNGFESDNCADGAAVEPYTSAVFSNVTFVGPMGREGFENNADYINGGTLNPNNGSALGKFQAAMQVRRGSHLACFNSIALGWPIGLIVDGEKGGTVAYAKEGKLKLRNIWLAGCGITGSDANKRYTDDLYDAATKTLVDANHESYSAQWFKAQAGNRVLPNIADAGLSATLPYMPLTGSDALKKADFTDAALSIGFDKVSFIGAFGQDDWTRGWTEWNPENADY